MLILIIIEYRYSPPSTRLTLYEGITISDGVINLGESITAVATTTRNTDVVNATFRWIDPSNNEVEVLLT